VIIEQLSYLALFAHNMQKTLPLIVQIVEDAPPPPAWRGPGRPVDSSLTDMFLRLKVSQCVDVNRPVWAAHSTASKIRKRFDSSFRVVARTLKPGVCRVWRVE
jgi:hypothetical protein